MESFLVAEAGCFPQACCANTAPSPSCVVGYRLRLLGSALSHFGRHRNRKTILNRFSIANPTSVARRYNPTVMCAHTTFGSKKESNPIGLLLFLADNPHSYTMHHFLGGWCILLRFIIAKHFIRGQWGQKGQRVASRTPPCYSF